MIRALRWLLGTAAASLLAAAVLHAGLVIPGRFDDAAMYETSVAAVLLVGMGLTFIGPGWARWGGAAAGVVALAGGCIGLYMAIRGVAPNTTLDIVYHVGLLALLLVVIGVAWRIPSERMPSSERR